MYDETGDGTCFRLYIITKYGKLNECEKLLSFNTNQIICRAIKATLFYS